MLDAGGLLSIAYLSISTDTNKTLLQAPRVRSVHLFLLLSVLHVQYSTSVNKSASFLLLVYRNIYFRTLVEEKRRVYVSAHFKREKRFIAETIVVAIKNLDPPGRFLSRDSKTGVWFPINDDRAREKASQALRENSKTIKAELQQSDDSIRKQGELLPEKRTDSSPDYTGSPTSQQQSRQPGHSGSAYCAGNRGGMKRATFETQHHPHHYPYPPAPGWAYPYYYGYQVPPFPPTYHPYAFPPPLIPAIPVGGASRLLRLSVCTASQCFSSSYVYLHPDFACRPICLLPSSNATWFAQPAR